MLSASQNLCWEKYDYDNNFFFPTLGSIQDIIYFLTITTLCFFFLGMQGHIISEISTFFFLLLFVCLFDLLKLDMFFFFLLLLKLFLLSSMPVLLQMTIAELFLVFWCQFVLIFSSPHACNLSTVYLVSPVQDPCCHIRPIFLCTASLC